MTVVVTPVGSSVAGSGVPRAQQPAADGQRAGRPQGHYAQALPGADGKVVDTDGRLDGEAGRQG
ncbi:hypothetical protein [Streptomyces sp. NBC_01615]|uniref:hypothetical protein n=1 Tax=Streptomyces sp. NBC_01615 TaxID=2975898 RepID=UPI00386E2E75